MNKITKIEDLYLIDLDRRKLENIPTHIDKMNIKNNNFYLSYHNYYHGWYSIYTVFKRYDDGRSYVDTMTSYEYEEYRNLLHNYKGKFFIFGLIEVQLIKPKIFNIECSY